THLREHHIVADIAYAIYQYYSATDDLNFMIHYGLEMLLETARFWASRVELKLRTKKYDIKNVIGPDEFHENVNNNAYTNYMAQWNMRIAVKTLKLFKKRYGRKIQRLLKKIKMNSKEISHMSKIASVLANTLPHKNGLIEQFDGYFLKRHVKLRDLKKKIIPDLPKTIPLNEYNKTQLIKQADVVMLLYLLGDQFDFKTKKKNYQYYLQRTLHTSSLSPSIHAIMSAEVGDRRRAYQFFLNALFIDLKNIYGNTPDGIHGASLGGTWQTVINGFAGLRAQRSGILCIDPNLPDEWKSLRFKILWKNVEIHCAIFEHEVEVFFKSKTVPHIKAIVFQQLKTIYANRWNNYRRELS
ncbi:MAG: glycoside hydrolase family 65 protein, partial [Elusimicrobia bacterium]|nr:glycoside hydrolase family 65 protein [Elusimicrobiota bacterium]